jgi:hypothetical protein
MADEIIDKGGDDVAKGGEGAAAPETVAKGEFDRVSSELEELRGEVLSPEYLEFLANKDKPKSAPAPEVKSGVDEGFGGLTAKQIEGMSKTELLRHAAKIAKEEAVREAEGVRRERSTGERENVRREITAFAKRTPDFDKYRPAMHGLSLDPKNADMNLDELYAKAKTLYGGTPEDVKNKQRKLSGEKPGGSSDSLVKDKKYTPEEAAREAMDEVKEKHGGFPSA